MRISLLFIKPLVVLFSLIVIIGASFYLMQLIKLYGEKETSVYMQEVNGLTWGTGKNQLMARVEDLHSSDFEQQRLLLIISNPANQTLFKKELVINWDMWDAGFLKSMQVDSDPELEIVFKTNRNQYFNLDKFSKAPVVPMGYNFYLDINDGKVIVNDFKLASTKAQEIAETYLTTNKPLTLQLILFFSTPLMVAFLYRFLMKFFLRKQNH